MANEESRVAELLSVLREAGDDSRASLSVELATLYLGPEIEQRKRSVRIDKATST